MQVPETLAPAYVSGHLGMITGTYSEDGIIYVPSKVAAKNNGLSADYISRMCRENQVQSTWHQGMWFVNERSLINVLAARRDKLEKLAAQQSETLKRLHGLRETSPARAIANTRAVAISQQPRQTLLSIPVAALGLLICVLLATTAFALPGARASITAQLPADFTGRVAHANWPPATDVRNQIAAIAASIPDTIRDRLNDFFCWWLACEPKSVAIEDDVSRNLIPASPTRQATSSVNMATAPTAQSSLQPNLIQQPLIERVVETVRTIVQSGLTEAVLDARLSALNSDLTNRIGALASANTTQTIRIYENISDALLFDEVTNLILHSPVIDDASITGGTIVGATIVGTLSNAIDTALATITSLTANEFVAINASTTNATSTNLYVAGSLGFGTGTGLLQNTAGVISNLAYGANGQVLKMVSGAPVWGVDISGGGSGGAGFFSTTTDNLAVFLLDTTDVFLVGNNATTTTGHILEVSGSALFRNGVTAYGSLSAPRFVATSSIASVFPFASTTALSATNASTTNLVISSVPGALLATNVDGNVVATTSISGNLLDTTGNWSGTFDGLEGAAYLANAFSTSSATNFSALGLAFSTTSADAWKNTRNFFSTTSSDFYASVTNAFSTTSANYFIASSTTIPKTYTANVFSAVQTFDNASTTNLSSSYASSTSAFVGSLSIGALSGFLKATAGAVATSLVDLASDVTGILGVGRGGTGWAAVQAGTIPFGNGANALATTSAGIDGQVLALLGGIPTWTATSTLATIDGTLNVSKGGTGATSFSYGLLLSPGGTSAVQNIATSSLGLLTTHVGEGVSLYYTDVRVQTYLGTVDKGFFFSTTSADVWKAANNFFSTTSAAYFASRGLAFSTTSSDYWKSVNNFFSTTSADYYSGLGLAFSTTSTNYFVASSTTIPKTYATNTWTGSNVFSSLTLGFLNGPLHSNGGVLSATTSVGVLYGGTGLTSAPTYGQMLVGNSSGGYTLTATSSLGIAGGSSLSGTQGQVAYFSGTNTAVGTSTLFIASSGNVGIGTTTPARNLVVNNTSGSAFISIVSNASNTAGLILGDPEADFFGQVRYNNSDDSLALHTLSTERFRISSTGNVGIGTTTPARSLDVYGSDIGGFGALSVTTPSSSLFTGIFSALAPNLTPGQGGYILFGKSGSLNNSASMNFSYAGDGSTSNRMDLNFFGASPVMSLLAGGNVGIGVSAPTIDLAIGQNSTGIDGATANVLDFYTAGTNRLELNGNTGLVSINSALYVQGSNNVGIASTTPWRTLSVTGTVGFSGTLSAESGSDEVLCIDPTTFEVTRGGASCAASSRQYKENIQDLDYDLDAVLAMRPVSFQWTLAERPNDRSRQVGFIAEEMLDVVPEVVELNTSGTPQGIDYDKLTSVIVMAIKQLAAKVSDTAHLVIDTITARLGLFDKVRTKELCVEDVCVTRDQFAAAFGSQTAVNRPPANDNAAVAEPSATTSPTVIDATPASEPAIEFEELQAEPAPEAANDNLAPPSAEAI